MLIVDRSLPRIDRVATQAGLEHPLSQRPPDGLAKARPKVVTSVVRGPSEVPDIALREVAA
jgi:hypothetical protein